MRHARAYLRHYAAMLSRLSLALLVVSLTTLGSARAERQHRAPADGVAQITVTPQSVAPGATISVAGQNFEAGEVVNVGFGLKPLVNVAATANGVLQTTAITVPLSARAGSGTVYAYGLTSKRLAVAALTVQALHPSMHLSAAAFEPSTQACAFGSGFGPGETVWISVDDTIVTAGQADAAGGLDLCFIMPGSIVSGGNTVSARGQESGAAATGSFTGVLPVAATYYFAGGSTANGDDTEIRLLNPGTLRTQITLTFYSEHGRPLQQVVVVPAHAYMSVRVGSSVPAGQTVGVRVEADKTIAAQMVVHRRAKAPYSTLGAPSLSTTSYLAAGETGATFHELLYVLNPQQRAATVRVQAVSQNNERLRARSYTVTAQHVAVLDLNRLYPRHSISAIVHSDRPVMVTRVMTFGPQGYGANANIASTQPQSTWRFADGSITGGIQTGFAALNPDKTHRAVLTMHLYGPQGDSLFVHSEPVLPGRRATIGLNDVLLGTGPALRAGAFQVAMSSTVPLIVERTMYYGNPNAGRVASSAVTAPAAPALAWSFAGGDTTSGNDESLLAVNPNRLAVPVHTVFFLADGTTKTLDVTLPPLARTAIDVAGAVPSLAGTTHGMQLISLDFLPFVVEQGIYTPGYTGGYSAEGLAQ